jgi:mono/diheme cytochrome c family protein
MQMKLYRLFQVSLLVLALAAAVELAAGAGSDPPPGPDAAGVATQGLTLSFAPGGEAGAAAIADIRKARLVALYVPHGTAPTPFLDPGKFVATWTGAINLRLRDTYTFSAQGRGKLTVTIGDAVALDASGDDFAQAKAEPVRLKKGANKLVVRYESADAGDAWVRLFWTVKGETFPDPVPPTVFTHEANDAALGESSRVRDGRMLVAELRCTRCHAAPGPTPDKPRAPGYIGLMPELEMDAPALTDAGSRLNPAWLAAWINNPRTFRANAHMPRVFRTEGAGKDDKVIDPRAADVAAYLASLGGKAGQAGAPADGTAESVRAGGVLFTHLNCVACHLAPDADAEAGAPDDPVRTPLRHVRLKFRPRALKQYLLKPQAHYAWNPMPNFKLTDTEAGQLADYLNAKAPKELNEVPPVPPAGDAGKGKQLVQTSGCVNCHAVGEERTALKVAALADIPKDAWSRGCMAKDDAARKTSRDFHPTDAQRTALLAFAATDRSSLFRDAAPEFAERQFAAMNCVACHARDGRESLLATAYDEEFRKLQEQFPAPAGHGPEGGPPQGQNGGDAVAFAPDQRAPLVTWAGQKLRPEWMGDFIAGKVPYKPRPYLHARMPAFPARAAPLAAGLAQEHGCPPKSPPPETRDEALAAAGSELAGKSPNESFSCVQCHAVASAPPFAPFEAPAVNFAYSAERLRKDYYHWWVHNPLKVDPQTKMPAFERDDGKTPITTVYEGDARKQFEAVWHYLLAGKDIKPPAE